MWTQTSHPTQRSRSISHQLWRFWKWSYCWILTMQSTGQTSRQASQPVQLSALITASSLGSFLRGPALAMERTFIGISASGGLHRCNPDGVKNKNYREESAAGQ